MQLMAILFAGSVILNLTTLYLVWKIRPIKEPKPEKLIDEYEDQKKEYFTYMEVLGYSEETAHENLLRYDTIEKLKLVNKELAEAIIKYDL